MKIRVKKYFKNGTLQFCKPQVRRFFIWFDILNDVDFVNTIHIKYTRYKLFYSEAMEVIREYLVYSDRYVYEISYEDVK